MDDNSFVVQGVVGHPMCRRMAGDRVRSAFTGKGTGMAMVAKEMWRSCADVAAALTIPEPFDFQTFVDILGAERNRPIELIPAITEPGTPCGLLASTQRADYIFYAANTTSLHQLHIQCHELAHLLRHHTGTAVVEAEVAHLLMPSLPVSVIERVLGRTVYSDAEEHDAELLASLIMQRIGRTARPGRPVTPAIADTLTRLGDVFDRPLPPRRG